MKNLLKSKTAMSLLLIGLAAIIIGGATQAWFTDDATIEDATFTAGTVIVESEGPEYSEGLSQKLTNINPGDCGRVTWNIINEGSKTVELRVKITHLWEFALGELEDPFAYYPLGDDWVMYDDGTDLWLYYTGGPVPGTFSDASLEERTIPLTLVVAWDGPKMGNEFQGQSVILGYDDPNTEELESYVDAVQASNDAPKAVWGEDFWNAVTADPFVPTDTAADYLAAVSATNCWEGGTVEPDPNEVVANINPSGLEGTVIGTGTFPPGSTVNLEAPAIDGYDFTGWSGTEGLADVVTDVAARTLSFTMPDAGVSVTANYNAPAPKFDVTIIKDCKDGADGTFTGDGSYEAGDAVTASATPDTYGYWDGWHWRTGTYKYKWYERTAAGGPNQWTERASNSDYVFTMPAEDVELKVKFYKY